MMWRVWAWRLPVAAVVVHLAAWSVSVWWAFAFDVAVVGAIGWAWATGRGEALVRREWVHRSRCRVRWSWRATVAGAGLVKNGDEPVIRWRIRLVDGGLWWRVRPARGHDAAAWMAQAGPLCKQWRCSELEIRDALDRRGRQTDMIEVSCSLAGVMLRPVEWPYRPSENHEWSRSALPVGQFAGGRPATVSLDEQHLMVGGPPGSGKSVFLHTLLCALGPLDDEAIVVFDLKGVDLQPWRPRCAAFCHRPEDARPVLAWLSGLMDGRYRQMQDYWAETGEHRATWLPHPGGPHVTAIIDEFAELPADLFQVWDRLARVGRAAGISLVSCTQRPAAELGDKFTRVRSNSVARLAMGPLGPQETGMVIDHHRVPKAFVTLPTGTGRLVSGEAQGKVFRAYWSEPVMLNAARASIVHRPALTMSTEVVG